jgi:hypothetical protein
LTHRVRHKKGQPAPRQISPLASSAWISTCDVFAHIVGRVAERTAGQREARGATLSGVQYNSLRLPGFVISAEVIFGMPDQALTT